MKISRRCFIATASAAALSIRNAQARLRHGGAGTSAWRDIQISGGGNVAGIDIHSDGTILQRGDVFGLWMSNVSNAGSNGNWQQLFTAASMPNVNFARTFWTGVYDAKCAPSNSSTIVAVYSGNVDVSSAGGGVIISRNKGTSWSRITGITSAVPGVNHANDAFFTGMIVFNPTDDSEFYVSVTNGGLWHCTSFGASCTRMDPGTIPAATSGFGYYGMAWKGNTILVGVYGTGAYVSTNGSAGPWALSSTGSPPTQILTGGFASDGTYFALNNNSGTQTGANVYRRTTGGTWALISPNTIWRNGLAIDPNNKDHIVIFGNGGAFDGTMNVSTNATTIATWQGDNQSHTISSGDTPWMGWSFNGSFSYLNAAGVAFDTSGRLWVAMGIGVIYTTSLPAPGTATTYVPMTQGSEGLQGNWVRWVPNGPALLAAWDRPGWVITNPNVTQSTHAPDNFSPTTVRYGDAIDYAQNNTSFFVMGSAGTLYFSSNGGVGNWTAVTTSPFSGGARSCALAVFSSTQWVFMDKSSGNVSVTANGGTSWTPNPTGLTAGDFAGAENSHPLCYDAITAGTAYIVNTSGTVFKTTDFGATWSRVSSIGALPNRFVPRLKAVVGKAGHLFYAPGNEGSAPSGQPQSTNAPLQFSNDGGATWTAVTNAGFLQTVPWDVATTPAAPGQSYPSVAVYGWMKTALTGGVYVLDVWRCDNFSGTSTMTGNTWTQMNWTLVGEPCCIEGNPVVYNQWVMAIGVPNSGLGFQYYGPVNVTW